MKVAVIVLAIVAVVAAGVAGFAVWKIDGGGAKVPDVVGMKTADAKAALAGAGYAYVVDKTYSNTAEAGMVAKQEPAAGDKAAKGSAVTVWVSEGGEKVAVPDVAGMTVAEADTALSAEGLNTTAVSGTSGSVAKGAVYEQVPTAGTEVPRASVITVYYNGSSPTVTTPALTGLTEAQASTRLQTAGLLLGSVGTQASSTAVQGTVVAQSVPATTSVARGTKVNITLAGGPPGVVVPDVLNMYYKQAETKLAALGFEVRVKWVPGGGMSPGAVVKVDPAVGTSAPQGSLVVLSVEETSSQ
jgi:beta-lactam-binding protein with PASTA domain